MNPITHQNLESMRDGAFAFGRYTLFARKARASGQAELFESFANAEALDDHLFEQQARDVGAMA